MAAFEIWVGAGSLIYLALLGFLGAYAGGAKPFKPTARVVFWGAVAMAITAGIGRAFGAVV